MRKPLPPPERSDENQSLVRAVAILNAVAAAPAGVGISSLARSVSLPVATVSRLVRTLETLRLLARLPGSRAIVLGMGIAELGTNRVIGRELRGAALPHVEALAALFGEAVELAQVVDDRARHLAEALDVIIRIESTHVIRATFSPHGSIPVHATSVGKILLSNWRTQDLERLLTDQLAPLASGTITDPIALRDEVLEVRRTGVAFGSNEVEEGAAGLAVAVRGDKGELIAILHVEGPSSRLTPTRMKEISREALRASEAIEEDFRLFLAGSTAPAAANAIDALPAGADERTRSRKSSPR